jgi:tRNA U34 5-methylaminomethyl-2-thiouridine-forming methyltransferase MnmC
MNQIVSSKDGSDTLYSKTFKEHYHSTFGAIKESEHIFIHAALQPMSDQKNTLRIFEVGFGSGLNALLSFKYAQKENIHIEYHAVEAFPIAQKEMEKLNYPELTQIDKNVFFKFHSKFDQLIQIDSKFQLTVYRNTLQKLTLNDDYYDVVFYDAFSPGTQPEMWETSCFNKIYQAMRKNGILTTYTCKGSVKRALKSVGFKIEKLPGPPGKREFLRAFK